PHRRHQGLLRTLLSRRLHPVQDHRRRSHSARKGAERLQVLREALLPEDQAQRNRTDPMTDTAAAQAATPSPDPAAPAAVAEFCSDLARLRQEVGTMIVGQEPIVEGVIMTILGGGHALLEGVPGLGKTMLVRTLAETLHATFSRIQFT